MQSSTTIAKMSQNNEVAKDFDDLFVNFIEEHKMQLWYDKYQASWTLQCPKPFTQVTRDNLKAAVVHMAFKLGDLRFKNERT